MTEPTIDERKSVRKMAALMEGRMRANDHKNGPTDLAWLLAKLNEEIAELSKEAIAAGDDTFREAADVANVAMIIACWCEGESWYD